MLTERQIQLLSAIIESYISKAEPVGSVEIVRNYNLKCSAATVRNEMAHLLSLGFLEMPHTSSGRIPTGMAYRMYLEELMDEDEMPVLQEVALKQRLWPKRFNFEIMIREAAIALAEITRTLVIITTNDGFMIHAGAFNVLDNKEFWDIDVAKAALLILDNYEILEKIISSRQSPSEINYLIGEEIGIKGLEVCSVLFSEYTSGKRRGHIVIIGPSRLNYPEVIPALKYAKNVIEELGEAW